MECSSVDLPEPEEPMIAVNSPFSIVSETWSSAVTLFHSYHKPYINLQSLKTPLYKSPFIFYKYIIGLSTYI